MLFPQDNSTLTKKLSKREIKLFLAWAVFLLITFIVFDQHMLEESKWRIFDVACNGFAVSSFVVIFIFRKIGKLTRFLLVVNNLLLSILAAFLIEKMIGHYLELHSRIYRDVFAICILLPAGIVLVDWFLVNYRKPKGMVRNEQ